MIEKTVKYKIEKSEFPEGDKTHLVVRYSATPHGYGYGRVFKGSYQECKKQLEILNKRLAEEKENESKGKNIKLSRKK